MNTDRPLDRISAIRTKLAVLVGASFLAAILVSEMGSRAGVSGWVTVPVTLAAALALTHWLSTGLTQPLRDLTEAAGRMARGDYSTRITDLRPDETGQLGSAFNDMAEQLATHDRQRRELIATVSHEIRTPLTAQRALLENLVDGVGIPDHRTLETALAQSERLSALVEDLLDLSRLDAGAATLTTSRVSVAQLVASVTAESRLAGREITYAVDVPTELTVEADEARLAQVAANLLDNAARHSPTGGTVTITGRIEPGDQWSLTVLDEGPGISAVDAERVFERFGTGSASALGTGGTGLGLAIARWICELHGGSVAVLATPPGARGARVRVLLPQRPTSTPKTTQESTMPTPTQLPPSPIARPAAPPDLAPTNPYAVTAPRALWPERVSDPQVRLLLAAVGVGLLAAITQPLASGLGLGLFVVLAAGAAVVYAAAARRWSRWLTLGAALTMGLISLVVLRASEGIEALGMLGALALTASVLTGARTPLGSIASAAAWPASAIRGLPLLGRTITVGRRSAVIWPVLRTLAVTVGLILVFGVLFASGDALFGSWASSLVPDLGWDGFTQRTFFFVLGWGFTLTGAYLALNPPTAVSDLAIPVGKPTSRAFEWLVPLASVSALFLVFHLAQATALWGGVDYLRTQTGLSYADYVHQGFGQLTAATALTLLVVSLAARKARVDTPSARVALVGMVTLQGVLTLGVVISALYRMDLYQDAYGFTVLRLFVDVFEGWLGLLVIAQVASILRPRWSGWVPRVAMVTGAAALIGLGLLNPAGWVADHNITRYQEGKPLDTAYLTSLGADAVPTIVKRLPAPLAYCVLPQAHAVPAHPFGLGSEWTVAGARARTAADTLPAVSDCAPVLAPLKVQDANVRE